MIRPIIRVQVHEVVLIPVHNNRARPLSNSTALQLPLRRDRHALMTPIRVELLPAHFFSRSKRNDKAYTLLLQHAEKVYAGRRQRPLRRDEVRSAAFDMAGVYVVAISATEEHAGGVPRQDIGIAVAGRIFRLQRLRCGEFGSNDTLVG